MTDSRCPSETFKGWLFKWTNYIKGYQKRWFVLSNGLLSYYRTHAEMSHTCRGTISLAGAYIDTEDSCNFVVSNGGTQVYHLKASSEVERQRWVTALELSKAKANRLLHAESDESGDDEGATGNTSVVADKSEVQSGLRVLASKLEDLCTCNDLIGRHGTALQRSLGELESLRPATEGADRFKTAMERATLFRITSNAMINTCRDFVELAQSQGRKWQKAFQHEREQRQRLEETLETLAKQHNSLERACRGASVRGSPTDILPPTHKASCESAKADLSDEDDENEFFDAMENAPDFITVAADPKQHKRTGSNVSASSSLGRLEEWNPEEKASCGSACGQDDETSRRQRRTHIPDKPNYSLNLWSIMKNCIGKDLSKIPMPVNFNEPLSMLQRLSEDLEYSELLDKAAKCENGLEKLCYLAAFSVSSYSTTVFRTGKPFNPLLGETFELDRYEEYGYRSLCEQVSHHPPAAAHYAESKHGWKLRQEITLSSKFRGKYLSISPLGTIHVEFPASGNHFTWKKVTITVHNIIVGRLWIDQSGDIEIVNHQTREKCQLKFTPYSYFSRDIPRKVTGKVMDAEGNAHYILSGTWDEKIECSKVVQSSKGGTEGRQKTVYQTLPAKLLWKRRPLP
uniref:Oxysterol-binding protein n=1 Tax=Eptatretus burgeri TaxID=7764 RepID=A0A8C4QIP4_EPTBU